MSDYTFLKTGYLYVHKRGDDRSYPATVGDDVSRATLQGQPAQAIDKTLPNFVPKQTVMAALAVTPNQAGRTILIKSGDYKETITLYGSAVSLEEEGLVVFRGNGTDSGGSNGQAVGQTIRVSYITGYRTWYVGESGSVTEATITCPVQFSYASFLNQCKVIGTSVTSSPFQNDGCRNCTLVNATVVGLGVLTGCDVGSGCTISMSNGTLSNNIRGTISLPFAGNGASGQGSTAGRQLDFATHKLEYPGYNVNSFSKPSLVNSVARRDLTLQASSPNYFGASVGNIGGSYASQSMYLADALTTTAQPNPFLPANGAQYTNLTPQGTDYVLTDPTQRGVISSAPIFNAATAQLGGVFQYVGKLAYDESPGGSYDCVPRVRRADGTLAPGLSYFMRWTLSPSQPVTAADWTNGAMAPATQWVPMLFGFTPQVDALGRGTADKGFDSSTAIEFGYTWYQVVLHLTNEQV